MVGVVMAATGKALLRWNGFSPVKRNKKAPPDRAAARRQFLALKPLRNPEISWEEDQELIVLTIKRPNNWKTRMANLLFPIPEENQVGLDAIGSDVWRWADGTLPIADISRQLAVKYKIGNREAELSLQQFFKTLGRRGYIGFAVEKKASEGTS